MEHWVYEQHDWLTGALSREAILSCVREVLETEPDAPHALLLFGLDRFHVVNDALGHREGDRLLCAIADLLMGFVRLDEPLGRIGGDIFLLLLRGAEERRALTVAGCALEALAAKPFHNLIVTASAGVAFYPRDGQCAEQLVQKARDALAAAKAAGRNRVSC